MSVLSITAFGQPAQKKVLLQQIAALKVYGEYVGKGYNIAKKGLATIGNLKDGEFSLHQDFFQALKVVSPGVRNYSQVVEIIALQLAIVKEYHSLCGLLYDDLFHGDEKDYIIRVYRRLLTDCENNLENLYIVITDSSLEMNDEQRLERIGNLFEQMQANYTFCRAFGNETRLLLKERQHERNDIHKSRILNNLTQVP